jgi:co-chaperonin GroES (HSP10)
MAKKDVKDSFVSPQEVEAVKVVKPCGSQILIELLTVQEIMNTNLILNNSKQHTEYQGFVLAHGPGVDPSVYGFGVGDRVLLSGSGVPVPSVDNTSERERILMEPHSIKAVLS